MPERESKFHSPNNDSDKPITPSEPPTEKSTLSAEAAPSPKQSDYSERRKRHTPLWKIVFEASIAIDTVGLLIVNLFPLCATRANGKESRLLFLGMGQIPRRFFRNSRTFGPILRRV